MNPAPDAKVRTPIAISCLMSKNLCLFRTILAGMLAKCGLLLQDLHRSNDNTHFGIGAI